MKVSEFLKPFKAKNRTPTYHLYAETMDALDSFIWNKVREERARYMKRMLEIGLINLDGLTPRMQKIIQVRFIEGLSLEETGQEFGVTRERIRQMETKALEYLKNPSPQPIRSTDTVIDCQCNGRLHNHKL